ncbi:hypothetical protein F2Q69_00033850 [Brassica cretica]|uniref:cellulase n=1 Tax=Brassica cretica TaxID=69181 RepID=A0A8S9STJ3_BRACR|nr:hypothetical protein F2Q69_00033850 [Brassica cretica]
MGKLLVTMLVCIFMAFQSLEALDYGDALNKSILFFEGQRSGKLSVNQRVLWRADSALSDGQPDNVNLIGGFYDAGDGNSDHSCSERPEDMDTPRTLYKINSSSPGSSAALASAALVFKTVDSNYSSKLLSHAKSVSILLELVFDKMVLDR